MSYLTIPTMQNLKGSSKQVYKKVPLPSKYFVPKTINPRTMWASHGKIYRLAQSMNSVGIPLTYSSSDHLLQK